MKWDVGAVTIRNAHVHDNDCKGLWGDIYAHGVLIEHKLATGAAPQPDEACLWLRGLRGSGRRGEP